MRRAARLRRIFVVALRAVTFRRTSKYAFMPRPLRA
jgi:hypothetical protein